ncbi:hypothetical protein DFQ27_007369 [Actinomortierella ambigua]|uniref:Arsenate reductase n=1 Tax=Actinomortierella ambigua TaxID=1343610 RepID=A0A9P6PV36_9FUNG|nr:hypothetical protein DFQ27_007369 [Actinomortierella ambigua]
MASRAALTIFTNPRCSKSREALARLREASQKKHFDLEEIEYLKTPPTQEQIASILDFLDAEDNPQVFKDILRSDAPKADSVADVQTIISQDPSAMQRPIIVNWADKKAVIGRTSESIDTLLASL